MNTRSPRIVALWLCAPLVAHCTPSRVGAPCQMDPPLLADGSAAPSCATGRSCFEPVEGAVESQALQCETRVCLTYHWDQQNDPNDRAEHQYCSCRCSGPGDPSTLCQCPAGFTCAPIFPGVGDIGLQGSYCVRAAD